MKFKLILILLIISSSSLWAGEWFVVEPKVGIFEECGDISIDSDGNAYVLTRNSIDILTWNSYLHRFDTTYGQVNTIDLGHFEYTPNYASSRIRIRPDNSIILKTNRGYLEMVNDFWKYNTKETLNLESEIIDVIYGNPGTTWIKTSNSIIKRVNGKDFKYSLPDSIPYDSRLDCMVSINDTLWYNSISKRALIKLIDKNKHVVLNYVDSTIETYGSNKNIRIKKIKGNEIVRFSNGSNIQIMKDTAVCLEMDVAEACNLDGFQSIKKYSQIKVTDCIKDNYENYWFLLEKQRNASTILKYSKDGIWENINLPGHTFDYFDCNYKSIAIDQNGNIFISVASPKAGVYVFNPKSVRR